MQRDDELGDLSETVGPVRLDLLLAHTAQPSPRAMAKEDAREAPAELGAVDASKLTLFLFF